MEVQINIPILGAEETRVINRVLKRGILTSAQDSGGPEIQNIQKKMARFTESKFAVAINSGTSAIHAALHALGIGLGDEVLVPSFTFVGTVNPVRAVSASPVFVDILKDNYTMDPEDIEKKITKKTKAIIPVHLFGSLAQMDRIEEIAEEHDLVVIEDAAQALGSTYNGEHAGTFSDVGCFSMHPSKVITAGEGGIAITDNSKTHKRLLSFRNNGRLNNDIYDTFGLNLRMPEINAAIASVQLKKLKQFITKRRHNARVLSELLKGSNVTIPEERKGEKSNQYLYTIAAENRDRILEQLRRNQFNAVAYHTTPVHKMPFYSYGDKLPVTEWASSRVLSIPIHPLVKEKDLHDMAGIIRKNAEVS